MCFLFNKNTLKSRKKLTETNVDGENESSNNVTRQDNDRKMLKKVKEKKNERDSLIEDLREKLENKEKEDQELLEKTETYKQLADRSFIQNISYQGIYMHHLYGVSAAKMYVEAGLEAIKGCSVVCRGREVVPGRCNSVI
ncbi:hypothetical protein BpHYR1_010476 [Brachionus plicatilis]|uniref:Uncharacterized protein n=1 Tax=Brachionus plicatilis TaxID=10195 RepID=A0A3M7S0K2_BRAPC|nr:hypothetical protein BpHYR1_010476 [Brachionus plicatilis]